MRIQTLLKFNLRHFTIDLSLELRQNPELLIEPSEAFLTNFLMSEDSEGWMKKDWKSRLRENFPNLN